jgi:hypothetical protein
VGSRGRVRVGHRAPGAPSAAQAPIGDSSPSAARPFQDDVARSAAVEPSSGRCVPHAPRPRPACRRRPSARRRPGRGGRSAGLSGLRLPRPAPRRSGRARGLSRDRRGPTHEREGRRECPAPEIAGHRWQLFDRLVVYSRPIDGRAGGVSLVLEEGGSARSTSLAACSVTARTPALTRVMESLLVRDVGARPRGAGCGLSRCRPTPEGVLGRRPVGRLYPLNPRRPPALKADGISGHQPKGPTEPPSELRDPTRNMTSHEPAGPDAYCSQLSMTRISVGAGPSWIR